MKGEGRVHGREGGNLAGPVGTPRKSIGPVYRSRKKASPGHPEGRRVLEEKKGACGANRRKKNGGGP